MDPVISDNIVFIGFTFLLVAFLLAFIRLLKGPSINDRVAALDLIASVVMGFIVLYSVFVQKALYIDIVIALSLVSFMGSVAISAYLKQTLK